MICKIEFLPQKICKIESSYVVKNWSAEKIRKIEIIRKIESRLYYNWFTWPAILADQMEALVPTRL